MASALKTRIAQQQQQQLLQTYLQQQQQQQQPVAAQNMLNLAQLQSMIAPQTQQPSISIQQPMTHQPNVSIQQQVQPRLPSAASVTSATNEGQGQVRFEMRQGKQFIILAEIPFQVQLSLTQLQRASILSKITLLDPFVQKATTLINLAQNLTSSSSSSSSSAAEQLVDIVKKTAAKLNRVRLVLMTQTEYLQKEVYFLSEEQLAKLEPSFKQLIEQVELGLKRVVQSKQQQQPQQQAIGSPSTVILPPASSGPSVPQAQPTIATSSGRQPIMGGIPVVMGEKRPRPVSAKTGSSEPPTKKLTLASPARPQTTPGSLATTQPNPHQHASNTSVMNPHHTSVSVSTVPIEDPVDHFMHRYEALAKEMHRSDYPKHRRAFAHLTNHAMKRDLASSSSSSRVAEVDTGIWAYCFKTVMRRWNGSLDQDMSVMIQLPAQNTVSSGVSRGTKSVREWLAGGVGVSDPGDDGDDVARVDEMNVRWL